MGVTFCFVLFLSSLFFMVFLISLFPVFFFFFKNKTKIFQYTYYSIPFYGKIKKIGPWDMC